MSGVGLDVESTHVAVVYLPCLDENVHDVAHVPKNVHNMHRGKRKKNTEASNEQKNGKKRIKPKETQRESE